METETLTFERIIMMVTHFSYSIVSFHREKRGVCMLLFFIQSSPVIVL